MSRKIGRNAPCPCGSGKKYKRCCLPKEQRAARELQAAIPVPGAEPYPDGSVPVWTTLDLLANRVGALIKEGKLDEAEEACLELKRSYPDEIDWIERTAALLEARGVLTDAAQHYRQAADFARKQPGFDPDYASYLADKAQQLDSSE